MDIDRRESKRFKKTLPVIIHRPYPEDKIKTADVSMGGVSIVGVQKYYDFGQEIYIEILLPKEDSILCATRLMSICPRSKDAEAYRIGLQFLDMSDEDKEKLKNCIESS